MKNLKIVLRYIVYGGMAPFIVPIVIFLEWLDKDGMTPKMVWQIYVKHLIKNEDL